MHNMHRRVRISNRKTTIQKIGKSKSVYEVPGTGRRHGATHSAQRRKMHKMIDHQVNMQNRKMTIQKTGKSESVKEFTGTGRRYDH